MRGRGNNNRRGPNPLTRNYESNGPDVKIRGNAQHIADKYIALARDAQASGDRVIAENYLQHAEHYVRIILSSQSQLSQPVIRDDMADEDMDDGSALDLAEASHVQPAGSGPQPVIEDMPAELAFAANANTGNTLEEGTEAQPPRRITRRRLPRRTEGAAIRSEPKSRAGENNADSPPEAAVTVEKPRRGRRAVKVEKTEDAEQADA